MKTTDLIRETYSGITSNKIRSGLTVLGIVIGIASVIAMVSIGQGAQGTIQASIEGLGSNLLSIMPGVAQPGRGFVSSGRGGSETLKNADGDALKDIDGVVAVSKELQRRFQIISQVGNNTNSTIIGATADYAIVRNVSVDNGSFITDSHDRSLARVAVIGPAAAQDLFVDADPIGKNIRINKLMFRVIGVLKSKGGSGFFNQDDTVIIPLSTMQKILTGSDFLSAITVSVLTKDQMPAVQDELISRLSSRHHIGGVSGNATPDFSVISQADILGTLTQVTTTCTIFLGSVAGISLLVGGIGIMNMMLTAVTERTREIGLRKAIGARGKDIAFQFLGEAVMLTFVGGMIGIFLGWVAAFTVSKFAGITTSVSITSVLLAFGVSAAIGIMFGYYPARRASTLNPIEALRYE